MVRARGQMAGSKRRREGVACDSKREKGEHTYAKEHERCWWWFEVPPVWLRGLSTERSRRGGRDETRRTEVAGARLGASTGARSVWM